MKVCLIWGRSCNQENTYTSGSECLTNQWVLMLLQGKATLWTTAVLLASYCLLILEVGKPEISASQTPGRGGTDSGLSSAPPCGVSTTAFPLCPCLAERETQRKEALSLSCPVSLLLRALNPSRRPSLRESVTSQRSYLQAPSQERLRFQHRNLKEHTRSMATCTFSFGGNFLAPFVCELSAKVSQGECLPSGKPDRTKVPSYYLLSR